MAARDDAGRSSPPEWWAADDGGATGPTASEPRPGADSPGPAARAGGAGAGDTGLVVRVVPDVVALRRRFDYLVPPQMAGRIDVGSEVRIVLHGRRVRAWVAEVDVTPPHGVVLRPLAAARGVGPPPAVLELALWAAWRWAGSVATFLRTASSSTVVRELPGPALTNPPGGVVPAGSAPWGVVPAGSAPGGVVPAGSAPGGVVPAGSAASVRRTSGGIDIAAALAGGTTVVRLGPAADPTDLVMAAAARLGHAGSGGGVLVVVPETRQVRAVSARLRRAGFPVAELPDGWALARRGGCVVVGTRAAAWAPIPAVVAAVVLDAHEEALVEQRSPTWSAWAVVAERARREGAPCALVSPCPSLELLAAGRLVAPTRAAERQAWPPVEVIDRRAADPRHGLLSPRVAELTRWATDVAPRSDPAAPARLVICVVNRTGGARLVACAACGELARCPTCHGSLELVDGTAPQLACRRCATSRPVVCARCGSTSTRALRLGVTRLRRDLQALAGGDVAEVTGASADDGGDPSGGAPVVVGTDAALRRIGNADAVVLLDLDTELLAPRLRAAEEAMALVVRAARSVRHSMLSSPAGRAPGRVVLQTRQPSHPVVRAAVAGDPSLVAAAELDVRTALRMPPVTAVAHLGGPGALGYAEALSQVAGQDVEIDGPFAGIWAVRAPDVQRLCDVLASVPRPPERLRVEVDPQHM